MERWQDLTASQYGLITRAQARTCGLSDSAIRNLVRYGTLRRRSAHVFQLLGSPGGWSVDVMTAVLTAGPNALASHRTAAVLWGFLGFRPGPPEVIRPAGRSRTARVGLLHETADLSDADRTAVEGIPLTAPPRTIVDIAGIAPARLLERIVDDALARGLTSLGSLQARFDAMRSKGRYGVRDLAAILEARGPGYEPPASELERRLSRVLDRAGLPSPVRQVTVGGTHAAIGRVDLVYRRERLVIEADSRRHHTMLGDWESDAARDLKLQAAGWRVVRVTWHQVTNRPHLVVEAVAAALAASTAA